MPPPKTNEPPARIQIEEVEPQLDCGRYPIKASLGDRLDLGAAIFRDGHEILGAAVRYKKPATSRWQEVPLEPLGNDRWRASLVLDALGLWCYRIVAWVDRVASFQDELRRKVEAGQRDLSGELAEGALLLDVERLTIEEALAEAPTDRHEQTRSAVFTVDVDRELARFGAWYELFPRSWGGFEGVRRSLPRFADLGFDVLYLPPIHPIGHTNRKGRNNAISARPDDVGSPWAIGSEEGGFATVHPELGTLEDFDRLVADAREHGIEVALDFAIQCSPDHPWLREHPEWFNQRPDGTLKYAENPPKRYQDIYNVNWESEDWRGLWQALLDVVLFWVGHGVTVFRVDNPHTKPAPFWEWLIREVRAQHPEAIFLAEAFTAPAMMTTLAKLGFAQSYTYFTWRNTRLELVEFIDQLLEWKRFYRPNLFANTPDILHEYLQRGGRPAFEARLVLAGTLSPSYGIYSGFEHCENLPLREGSEEYLDSEKYEVKERRLDGPLLPLVRRLNAARRENAALQRLDNVTVLETENEQLLGLMKRAGENVVLVVVNLDPSAAQEGVAIVPAGSGLPPTFAARDLLAEETYTWHLGRNYVRLEPGRSHLLRVGA